jgi:transcriptional regulator
MYRIPHYDERRVEVLHGLIRAHPFATLLVGTGTDIVANHLPVLLRQGEPHDGMLVGHVARANPVWKIAGSPDALLIFQGVDHYISPRWYRSGQADAKAVPTWDYAVVHAKGTLEWIEDRAWLHGLLADMAQAFEQGERPWRIAEMPADHRDSMLDHIVGFRVSVRDLQGKFKLNQGSSREDRAAVIAALEKLGTDAAADMAAAISGASAG